MKCFLHIGTEKTATTTIQNFLDINRNILLDNGFIYTESAGKTNNRSLPVAAYDLAYRDDFTKFNGINSDQDLLKLQRKIISNLDNEIKNKSKRIKDNIKIILSSEHIQSRLTKKNDISRLKIILNDLGIDTIYIILYIRNPAETANSLFSTSIKYGSTEKIPPGPKNYYYNNICNHMHTLKKFGEIFGKSFLIPKIFHKSEFKNGSIIDDFCEIIGIPLSEKFKIPKDLNLSLSSTGINILRRINVKIPMFTENKVNPLRENIASYIERFFSDSKYIMPDYLWDQYNEEFSTSNEWVRKNFFPEKKSLFPNDFSKKESHQDFTDQQLDNISNLIIEIWTDKQNKILSLSSNDDD